MNALRYENNSLSVVEVDVPERDGEALVRVTLAGICNTDLEIVRGYAGFEGTLGHEFVGVVERAPDDRSLVGRRVVGEINAGCGVCAECLAGDARHCPQRTVLGIVGRDGAFAEFLTLPASNLLPVPDEVPDERAVFTEPLAAACGIMERTEMTRGMRVAVIGDGKLGLLCAQAIHALAEGAHVALVGKHPAKLRIAARRGIETITIEELQRALNAKPSTRTSLERATNRVSTNGESQATWRRAFDVAVEASGSSDGFATAIELLRPRGTLVLKSTFHGTTEINAAPIVVDEISIVGSRCGRFAPALELLKRNAVDVENLIDEEFPLTQGIGAFERAKMSGVLKVLLRN